MKLIPTPVQWLSVQVEYKNNSLKSVTANSAWEFSFIHDKIKENGNELLILSFKILIKQNNYYQWKHCRKKAGCKLYLKVIK